MAQALLGGRGGSELPPHGSGTTGRYPDVTDQYTGMSLSTVLAQAVMPPPRCLAVENPDCLSRASASAERTPDLQYRTTGSVWGSSARWSGRLSSGIRVAPGRRLICHSAGSRTAPSLIGWPLSGSALSWAGVMVAPAAACWASSETTPQNSS